MPLNYSKWDQLELSDDSDIEEHPNIDKKSMIRWKQQDIHQKRIERTARISKLRTEVALNETLRPRIVAQLDSLTSLPPNEAIASFTNLVQQLNVNPSDAKPETGAPNQPTYDIMLLHLLEQVTKEATDQGKIKLGEPGSEEKMAERLEERLRFHNGKLDERTKECGREIEREEKEQSMKITSEGIHDGFSSGYVNPATPNPMEETKKPVKKAQEIEVLNPSASSSSSSSAPSNPSPSSAEDDELPVATPAALAFLSVPYLDFDRAFEFVQKNPTVMFESTTDALLLEAFNAEIAGDKKRARVAVEKGLLVQFCRKLGKDGVRLFFQRMRQGGPGGKKAIDIFLRDVNETYDRMEKRVIEMAAETAARKASGEEPEGEEQIQLVAEGDATISFNIPDGPPPETITLEGEGTEGMDPVEVRKYLMRRWEIFEGLGEEMKSAVKGETLEGVNKVLAKMGLEQAEEAVGLMNEAGILSFQDGGAIRDETKGGASSGGLDLGAEGDDESEDDAELD